jgi:hypothetical protein
LTVACLIHSHHFGVSPERIGQFCQELWAVIASVTGRVHVWCVLPNHYWIQRSPLGRFTYSCASTNTWATNSVVVGGINPATDIYLVDTAVSFSGITGIRLEALADSSLPWEGPGRQPLNGNFVLTEFSVQAIPESGTVGLLLLGLGALGVICCKIR